MNKESTVRVLSAVALNIGKGGVDKQAGAMSWLTAIGKKIAPYASKVVQGVPKTAIPVVAGGTAGYAGRMLQDRLSAGKPENGPKGLTATEQIMEHLGRNAGMYGAGIGAGLGGASGYAAADAYGAGPTGKLLSALAGAGLLAGAGYFAGNSMTGKPAEAAPGSKGSK